MNSIEYLLPWIAAGPHAGNLLEELQREITEGHPLWQAATVALARRCDSDDVLFAISGGERVAVVHLTWNGKPEAGSCWPETRLFGSLDSWVKDCMNIDHAKYTLSN